MTQPSSFTPEAIETLLTAFAEHAEAPGAVLTRPARETASPPIGVSTHPQKQGTSARAVFLVLRTDDEVHTHVMAAFRKLGGNVDRWQPQDKRHMAHAIILAEDALELRRGRRDSLTSALRSIRRQLESEVFP